MPVEEGKIVRCHLVCMRPVPPHPEPARSYPGSDDVDLLFAVRNYLQQGFPVGAGLEAFFCAFLLLILALIRDAYNQ